MTNSETKVLNKLREKGSQGVTVESFPVGFRLAARIFDLRSRYEIRMIRTKGQLAKYYLIGRLKKVA